LAKLIKGGFIKWLWEKHVHIVKPTSITIREAIMSFLTLPRILGQF